MPRKRDCPTKLADEMEELQLEDQKLKDEFQRFSFKAAEEQSSLITALTDLEDGTIKMQKRISTIDEELKEIMREKERIKQFLLSNESMMEDVKKKKFELDRSVDEERVEFKQRCQDVNHRIEKILQKIRQPDTSSANQVTPPKENHQHGNDRIIDFLKSSIASKEKDLECPVCFETSTIPIFCCSETHLICSSCRPKLQICPECRTRYEDVPKRHRFAEKIAEEVGELMKELEVLQGPKTDEGGKHTGFGISFGFDEEEQKQMLGERLFPLIQRQHANLAGKITGMLLDNNNTELLHLLESPAALKGKVEEAVTVLQAHNWPETPAKLPKPALNDLSFGDVSSSIDISFGDVTDQLNQMTIGACGGEGPTFNHIPDLPMATRFDADLARQISIQEDTSTLFVGNLPWNIEEGELIELFNMFGRITEVKIHTRKQQSFHTFLPGFAFIKFQQAESIDRVLEQEPIMLYGNHRVRVAKKDSRKSSHRCKGGPCNCSTLPKTNS